MRQTAHDLLDAVLRSVGESFVPSSDQTFTGFAAAYGRESREGLLVIGRAVNGWTNEWRVEELRQPGRRSAILRDIEESVSAANSPARCPMSWVSVQWGATEGYNTARSAFWRCIRGVVSSLSVADVESSDWSSRVAWTNLYKVAPADGGNPSDALAAAQHGTCRTLLLNEIETSGVRRALFLTGLHWGYAFLPNLREATFADTFDRHVAVTGLANGHDDLPIRVVVASHPQGKNEADWIAEVAGAFQRD